MVLAASPVSEYVVPVEPVLACTVDHVVPLLTDLSILYPVITEPPLFAGATQDKLICDVEMLVAVRPVGDPGAVAVALVVAEAVLDGEPVPTELIADTR